MTIEPFCPDDIKPFMKLAAAENWVAEPWEFQFLLSEFPEGCFAARNDNGQAAGFVTSLRHEGSGWIGNLIVSAEFRGQGIGESLFGKALETLRINEVETIWLTASKSGQSLYEKYGFSCIDTIIRWVGTGRQRHAAPFGSAEQAGLTGTSYDLDAHVWGDRRSTLLEATAGRGSILQNDSGFIVLQPCRDTVQFGPFSTIDSSAAERLFDDAARSVAIGTKVVLDAPVSNRSALRLFNRRNMRIAGSNSLMYAGRKPDYRPEQIYGLATMGSCG
jgi:ribosomal protein S18 acetylase RimI-like enzyme